MNQVAYNSDGLLKFRFGGASLFPSDISCALNRASISGLRFPGDCQLRAVFTLRESSRIVAKRTVIKGIKCMGELRRGGKCD